MPGGPATSGVFPFYTLDGTYIRGSWDASQNVWSFVLPDGTVASGHGTDTDRIQDRNSRGFGVIKYGVLDSRGNGLLTTEIQDDLGRSIYINHEYTNRANTLDFVGQGVTSLATGVNSSQSLQWNVNWGSTSVPVLSQFWMWPESPAGQPVRRRTTHQRDHQHRTAFPVGVKHSASILICLRQWSDPVGPT